MIFRRDTEWRRWFAWYPVRVNWRGDVAWFHVILRRHSMFDSYVTDLWEYKLLGASDDDSW